MTAVAVSALCDFAARSGDLDLRYTPGPTAVEGIEGHRAVAARRDAGYQSEYPLQDECAGMRLSGRADGYHAEAGCLEEVKTHRGDLDRLNPGLQRLHRAQLRCYGALLCRSHDLEYVTLRLVYFNLQNDVETVREEVAEAEALWSELEILCERYRRWAIQETAHRRARDSALGALRFPFPGGFRAGQRPLSEAVFTALTRAASLLLQAPTGIGKTVGTLFPALMAMPRSGLDRLFFLTVRGTGRELALEGLKRIRLAQSPSIPIRVLALSAKDQACEYPERACHGESCPLARGFYDRLPAARDAAVALEGDLDAETVRSIALEHQVCPYYLAQDLARWADVVVADVNYFFDQQALLHAFTRQNEWRVGLLVDEAHNLIERARGMYSVTLSRPRLKRLNAEAPAQLRSPLRSLTRSWQTLMSLHVPAEAVPPDGVGSNSFATVLLDRVPQQLDMALQRLASAITEYLVEHPADSQWQELLFESLGFLSLTDTFDDHSVCELDPVAQSLSIRNLIPATFLAPRFAACHGAILFSATLNPYRYHRDLLGLPEGTFWHEVDSPFASDQLAVTLVTGVSTRLQDREASIAPVIARIIARYRRHPANYLVYLSSFVYLEAVRDAFRRAAPDVVVTSQWVGMSPGERQAFIAGFQEGGAQIGFAVLGGAFSEGIDLPGSRLSGVFILTLGLPPHDARHELLRRRLQAQFGQGYEYAYLYPGLQKVVQAAGRVIRTPDDRGTIELIDDRFGRREVLELLPGWWPAPAMVSRRDLVESIS